MDASLPDTDGAPRRSCKDRFFVRHTMKEAGSSRWAPWWLLFLTRCASMSCIAGITIFRIILAPRMDKVYVINLALAATFLLLAICTALHKQGVTNMALPTMALMIHAKLAVFSSYALITLVRIQGRTEALFSELIVPSIPFIFFLVDILVMHASMRLRWRCAFLAWFMSTVIDIFILITKVTKDKVPDTPTLKALG